MKFNRKQFWLLLQGGVVLVIGLYWSLWLSAVETDGYVLGFSEGMRDYPITLMHVEYYANHKTHIATFYYDKDFPNYRTGQTIPLTYLPFARGSARIPGFNAEDALFMMVYLMWLFVSALIFIMPNYFIGKCSYFITSWRFPFVTYYSGKPATHSETMKLIVNANLVAGLIEKFMLPFVASGVIALILYLSTWNVILVIISFVIGAILGVIRAVKWKKSLKPGDDQLKVLDQLPGYKD